MFLHDIGTARNSAEAGMTRLLNSSGDRGVGMERNERQAWTRDSRTCSPIVVYYEKLLILFSFLRPTLHDWRFRRLRLFGSSDVTEVKLLYVAAVLCGS